MVAGVGFVWEVPKTIVHMLEFINGEGCSHMIPEVDAYELNVGSIKGRRHVINHVDMLYGFGDKEWSNSRADYWTYGAIGFGDKPITSLLSECAEDEVKRERNWVLYQSLYATSWEQIFPLHDGRYFVPGDLETEEDHIKLLAECLSIWAFEDEFYGGDVQRFDEETPIVVLLGSWDPIRVDRIVVRQRPGKDIASLPVAINSRKAMEGKHGKSVAWRAFAERICQNEHVKEQLAASQGMVCPICGRRLGKYIVVHHVDYDHKCEFALSGEGWTIPGKRVQPDCKRCHMEHPEMFENCLGRLRAVHRDCNYLIEATL